MQVRLILITVTTVKCLRKPSFMCFIYVIYSRFKDFREPPWSSTPYDLSKVFWVVLAARLAFVIVFQVCYKIIIVYYIS